MSCAHDDDGDDGDGGDDVGGDGDGDDGDDDGNDGAVVSKTHQAKIQLADVFRT